MKLVINARYNWKNQQERLIYKGLEKGWHQFAKIDAPDVVWCEVLESDVKMLEETQCDHDWEMSENEGVKDCIECKKMIPMTAQDYEDIEITMQNLEMDEYFEAACNAT